MEFGSFDVREDGDYYSAGFVEILELFATWGDFFSMRQRPFCE